MSEAKNESSANGENLKRLVMPFTGHTPEHLMVTLKSISESGMPVEIFDAFLAEYVRTKCLDRARVFAMCEWDC